MSKITREDNPFENEIVAEEWIRSVEGEQGKTRDRLIYPRLREWGSQIKDGLIVDIGCGQGICSQYLGDFGGHYVGIEPSKILIDRAHKLYGDNGRLSFCLGNAYDLPIESNSADGALIVNVWFHLSNLTKASEELNRVLKSGAEFCLVTANPNSYDAWREEFYDFTEVGNMISGKLDIPVNPLSCNNFYLHTMLEIDDSLKANGLKILEKKELFNDAKGRSMFILIKGQKD